MKKASDNMKIFEFLLLYILKLSGGDTYWSNLVMLLVFNKNVFLFSLSVPDECSLDNDKCSNNSHCENTNGTLQCVCDAGYEGKPSIYGCYRKYMLMFNSSVSPIR